MWMLRIATTVVALVALACAQCPHEVVPNQRFSQLPLTAGAVVQIPAGQVYLLDTVTPVLEHVQIQGQLIADEAAGIELHAKQVTVYGGGRLIVGSCLCPFPHRILFELHGDESDADPDGVGIKGIGVLPMGTIHLFGEVAGPSWTSLASTANKGATSITLMEPVESGWRVGDMIELYSTDYDHNQAEIRTITSVVGAVVSFAEPLLYMHYSDVSHTVEMRGEVARLTRNILIRGFATDSDVDGFGAHVMMRGAFAEAFLQGVEVTRGGQAGHLGRYPFHFHMAGDVTNRAFIRDCVGHHNYQRNLVVHHTDKLVVQRNVFTRSLGHAIFLEDGIEQGNKFLWNLAAHGNGCWDETKSTWTGGCGRVSSTSPNLILQSDTQAATYWITNPNNDFYDNVAAGSSGHNVWVALPVNPMTDNSRTNTMCPRRTPLGAFLRFTSHSSNQDCLHIDRGPGADGVVSGKKLDFNDPDPANGQNVWLLVGDPYNPVEQPVLGLYKNSSDRPVQANIDSFLAYKCGVRGVWVRGGLINMRHPKFVDCSIGATFATNFYNGTVSYGTFVGDSNNLGTITSPGYEAPGGRTTSRYMKPAFVTRGYEYYDGPNSLVNSLFISYIPNEGRRTGAISLLRRDEFAVAASNDASGLRFAADGTNPIMLVDLAHDGDYQTVTKDLDGSLTGRPPTGAIYGTHGYGARAAVVNNVPFLKTSSCEDRTADYEAYICPDHFAILNVGIQSAVTYPTDLTVIPGLLRVRREGTSDVLYICGGVCNAPPSSDGSIGGGPITGTKKFFRGAIVLRKKTLIEFITSPPTSVGIGMQYADRFKTAAKTQYNEIVLGVCYPPGTTVTSLTYSWKTLSLATTQASSLEAMTTATPSDSADWNGRGTNMWFQDSNGVVWIRMIVPDERTEATMRTQYPAASVTLGVTLPSGYDYATDGPVTCPGAIVGGSNADEGLPPRGTPVPPPAWPSEIPPTSRDTNLVVGAVCSGATPSSTPSASRPGVSASSVPVSTSGAGSSGSGSGSTSANGGSATTVATSGGASAATNGGSGGTTATNGGSGGTTATNGGSGGTTATNGGSGGGTATGGTGGTSPSANPSGNPPGGSHPAGVSASPVPVSSSGNPPPAPTVPTVTVHVDCDALGNAISQDLADHQDCADAVKEVIAREEEIPLNRFEQTSVQADKDGGVIISFHILPPSNATDPEADVLAESILTSIDSDPAGTYTSSGIRASTSAGRGKGGGGGGGGLSTGAAVAIGVVGGILVLIVLAIVVVAIIIIAVLLIMKAKAASPAAPDGLLLQSSSARRATGP